ncbi:MAG: hypothetical protein ACPGF7_09540 [Pontibacterium sp.]
MKRFISLCSKEFDPLGAGWLEPVGLSIQAPRRASRTATLDGEAVIHDGGFSVADTTITLEIVRTAAADALLNQLQRYHNRVTLSCNQGFYTCGAMDVTHNTDTINIQLLPV